MTTSTAYAVEGDLKDTRILQVGGVADLTAVTAVEVHVWRDPTAKTTLTAAVADEAAGTISFSLGAVGGWLDTDAIPVGSSGDVTWWVEAQCTYADGSVLTFPVGAPARLVVRRQGA